MLIRKKFKFPSRAIKKKKKSYICHPFLCLPLYLSLSVLLLPLAPHLTICSFFNVSHFLICRFFPLLGKPSLHISTHSHLFSLDTSHSAVRTPPGNNPFGKSHLIFLIIIFEVFSLSLSVSACPPLPLPLS